MIESWVFWAMLAGALLVHASLPLRWRFWFLAVISIAYLCIASPNNVKIHPYAHALILLGLALACYYLAPLTADPRAFAAQGGSAVSLPRLWLRRLIFWGLISLILGYLCWMKYVLPSFWWRGAILKYYALPLGVSYFSFKLIDMLIYSARNPLKPRSLDSYLSSVFLFPTAAAGPIERYEHFQQNAHLVSRSDDLLQGATRIIYGLIKRFVIVESLFSDQWRYVTRGAMWEHLPRTSPWHLWWAAISVFLYLYIDFSAYSDIAIGCCRLFGIRLMENFNWPVFAPNIASFWKRWHMTLTGWCTSYVYMPIVGWTRRMNVATFATFVVIGLWHGTFKSNLPWLLWGIYNGLGMIGYQYWVRIKRFYKWAWCNHWMWYGAGIAVTLLFVSVGDLLALAEPPNLAQAGRILIRMSFLHGLHG
jgi:alginate O-acetyltransferase complex protein AlgI